MKRMLRQSSMPPTRRVGACSGMRSWYQRTSEVCPLRSCTSTLRSPTTKPCPTRSASGLSLTSYS